MDSPDTILAPLAAIKLPADHAKVAKSALAHAAMGASLTIQDDEGYALAAEDLQAIKAKWNKLEEQRTNLTGPLLAVKKGIDALFAGPLGYLKQAEDAYKAKMLGYQRKVAAEAERIRRENELAASQARLAAEAEAKRIADEAEAVRKQTEAEATRLAEEGHAEEAAALLAQGDLLVDAAKEEAAAIASAAAVTIAAPPPPAPTARGTSIRKTVSFEVTDLKALVKWVAANCDERPEVLAYLTPDSVKLRAQVTATGKATQIDGVRVFDKDSVAVR